MSFVSGENAKCLTISLMQMSFHKHSPHLLFHFRLSSVLRDMCLCIPHPKCCGALSYLPPIPDSCSIRMFFFCLIFHALLFNRHALIECSVSATIADAEDRSGADGCHRNTTAGHPVADTQQPCLQNIGIPVPWRRTLSAAGQILRRPR